jgi:signal transduction histidine kinase
MATYLREKYESRPPDVLVAGGEEALAFLLRARKELFSRVPVIHAGVSRSLLASLSPLPAEVIGSTIEADFSRTIDQILRFHPKARRLVLVTGSAPPDRIFEARLRQDVLRYQGRITPEFLSSLPMSMVLGRLAGLKADSIVFTPGVFRDGDGRDLIPREAVAAIAAASPVPVYAPFNTFIGTGIVGGCMPSFEAMGRDAGRAVTGLLDGAAPDSVPVPAVSPMALNLDWRQVRRWGIPESSIPPNTIVHFREPTYLEQHPFQALAVATVFLLQAALIGWLLDERRRRHTAEQAVQKQRFELAHASRLAVAGELTASIAHEINQPLGAILANADAADLILESGGNRRGELKEILSDIRRDDLRASEVVRRLRSLLAKHESERLPFEINEAVLEVELTLRAEARRREVTIDARPAADTVTIVGDRIQIQQVLTILLLNAMDAIAGMPEERRTVLVSVKSAADGALIRVSDRGTGIAPEHLTKLFDSFFSTKRTGMGLGLSIARTIVQAHGGRIWAENGAGEGAVLQVALPAASVPSLPSSGSS